MGFNFRIRRAFIISLLAIGWIPLAAFGWYSYDRTIKREFSEVEDRHLLLARNLSSALSRYEQDVRAAVKFIAISLRDKQPYPGSDELLETLKIKGVYLADPETGLIVSSTMDHELAEAVQADPVLLAIATKLSSDDGLIFTPVQKRDTGNFIFVVGRTPDAFVLARLGTEYFRELGDQISFGVKGHAAIVDQAGNVLAHPKPDWVTSSKNIASISSVQRMMNGETGIEQFYSPALKGDMIAGLTTVPGTGWGVMIPQPVAELYAKAYENLTPVFVGLLLAVVTALGLVILSIRWIARPLEDFTQDLRRQSFDGMPLVVPQERRRTSIFELQNIFQAYNALAVRVQDNAKEMSDKAFQDPITGIGNRAYFESHGVAQIERRMAQGRKGVFLFIDLDGFKEINDTRGHGIGDAYLRAFAEHIGPVTTRMAEEQCGGLDGEEPVVGRIGGDEFAILIPLPESCDEVSQMCEILRKSLPTTFEIDGLQVSCGASAGGAIYPDHGVSIDQLIRRADVALYLAKAQGKDGFELYSEINELGGRSEILSAVTQAITNDDLTLEYQPKFDAKSREVTGAEALLRWKHPRHGLISPDVFLPAIKQTHVMSLLGEWVTRKAATDMMALEQQGHHLNVSINIGAEHFATNDFVNRLIEQCDTLNFEASRLQIEVTEHVLDWSRDIFRDRVKALQDHGFSIAIDDFGQGYSNFARLATVPVDVIKLDRSLVEEAVASPRFKVIMQSAIDMSHALGSRVVLEGVETQEEIEMAQAAGVDEIQGFYFSASLSPAQLAPWLSTYSGRVVAAS